VAAKSLTRLADLLPKRKDEMLVNFKIEREKYDKFRTKLKKNTSRPTDFFRAVVDAYLAEAE
jgi:hypothetical protein